MAHRVPLISFLFPLIFLMTARTFEVIDPEPAHRPTCSKDFTDCSVKGAVVPNAKASLNVSQLNLNVFMCCTNGKHCKLCLRIQLNITVQGQHADEEVSGDHGEEHGNLEEWKSSGEGSSQEVEATPTESSARVCYSLPNFHPRCNEVSFRCCPSAPGDSFFLEMWLFLPANKEMFGSPVLITLSMIGNVEKLITLPSLQDVCSPDLYVSLKDCDVPRLRAVTDQKKGVALLQLDSSTMTQTNEVVMCQILGTGVDGVCTKKEWLKDQREMIIPLNAIAPCMCFRVNFGVALQAGMTTLT